MVSRPAAVDAWPVEMLAGVECLIARGVSTMRIAHESGFAPATVRAYRDWFADNGLLWPGPREMAIALVLACRGHHEDPETILLTPGTSRGRAVAYWALHRRYPGVPGVRLAKLLGCKPFGQTTDRYVEGFAARYSQERPNDQWWSPDVAAMVERSISQRPPFGPIPSWFRRRELDQRNITQKGEPVESRDIAPAPTPPVVQPDLPVQPAAAPVVVEPARVEEKPMSKAAAARVTRADDDVDDDAALPPPASVLRTLGGHAAFGIVGTFDPAELTGCARAVASIRHGQCRWPLGEVGSDDFRFCCDPVRSDASPYCATHAAAAKGSPGTWKRAWR